MAVTLWMVCSFSDQDLREEQALSRATDHCPAKGAALGDPFRVTIGAHHVATSEHISEFQQTKAWLSSGSTIW